MRDCSVEICAAFTWSSQKPGAPMASSSSARRRLSASGSKVITDPGELGPDLLEALIEAALVLGHAGEGSAAVDRDRVSSRSAIRGEPAEELAAGGWLPLLLLARLRDTGAHGLELGDGGGAAQDRAGRQERPQLERDDSR